jgi:hypothetical protein
MKGEYIAMEDFHPILSNIRVECGTEEKVCGA